MPTLAPSISSALLEQVSERIETRTGLHFPRERFADLERGLLRTAQEAGFSDPRAYVQTIISRHLTMSDIDSLASCLTIGETHFFRDTRAFTFLETMLMPALVARKRAAGKRIRIWSAGCASGEEPYSLAIMLHKLVPDLNDWNVTILGADINPKILAKAEEGIYSDWSFRDTPDWVKPRYFIPVSHNRYKIQPWVKRHVTFTCLNLAEDVYPSFLNNTNAFDLIICRNVLIYFSQERIHEVVGRFHRALVDDGQLVLGAVEASHMRFPDFAPVPAQGLAMFRKKTEEEKAENGPAVSFGTVIQPSVTVPFVVEQRPVAPVAPPVRYVPPPVPPLVPKAEARDVVDEARALCAAGRYIDARSLVAGAMGGQCNADHRAAAVLAQCHANLGELAEALVWCEKALAANRTDADLHFLHAGILQGMDRDDEAIVALRNVLFLEPCHIMAHFSTANLHRHKGRVQAAEKHISNIRQLLVNRDENEAMPQSGGFTVGRINAMLVASAPVHA